MTVQILDDTLAVLSFGKLCEENGCTHEWVSGQEPHLTKNGKKILCNMEKLVPVVVPGLSSSSSASSSSTSLSQDSSSASPSPARLRSDHTHAQSSGNQGQQSSDEKLIARSPRVVRGAHRKSRRYRGAGTRKHFSRFRFGTSCESGTKEAQSIYTHFPKDQTCEVCERTKITRALCRRRTGDAVLRAEIFSDLMTEDHKVLSESCESRNNHRYAVVVQDLAAQWIQSYLCKT